MPSTAPPYLTGRRRLYLMRHGHVDYFAPGLTDFTQVPLTAEGRAQAQSAGEALAQLRFDAVFTSGLPRTAQTAEQVLAENIHACPTPIAIPGFEEIRGGQAVFSTREELAAQLAFSFDHAAQPEATFLPGGEKFADALMRIDAALTQMVGQHPWRQALLVAHDGVNRLLLGMAAGAGLAGAKAFEQDLAAINILDLDVVKGPDGTLEIVRTLIKAVNVTAYDYTKTGLPKTSLEHLFDIDFGGARPLAE